MRKNKSKFSKISLKQLYSDLKKVTGKRTSKFGDFKQRFKDTLRKHGKTIAVVGGTTLAVAGTAAALHYRNEKQLEAKNKEIQSKEQQFHAKELEANAAIQNIKNAQEADKKLLDAEKKQTKKLEERNKLLEQLAKEKEELLVEERRIGAALNKIKISYLRNQIKDTTRSLQDKEAELREAITNQRVAFTNSVAEKEEEKETFHDAVQIQPESALDIAKIAKIQALARGNNVRKEQSNLKRALGISIDKNTIFKLAEQEKLIHPILDRPATYILMDKVFGNHLGDNRSMYHFGYTIHEINDNILKPNQKELLQQVISNYQIRKDEKLENLGIFAKLKLGLVAAKTEKDAMEIINKMLNYLQYIYELKTLEYKTKKETEERLRRELDKKNTAATTIQAVTRGVAARKRVINAIKPKQFEQIPEEIEVDNAENLINALNLQIDPSDDDFEEDIKNNPVLNSALMIIYMQKAFKKVSFGKKNKKRSSRFGYNVNNVDKLYLSDSEKILLRYVIKNYNSNEGIIGTLILGLDDAKTIDQELDILNKMIRYLFLLNEYIKTKEQRERAATKIQSITRGVLARKNVVNALSQKKLKTELDPELITKINKFYFTIFSRANGGDEYNIFENPHQYSDNNILRPGLEKLKGYNKFFKETMDDLRKNYDIRKPIIRDSLTYLDYVYKKSNKMIPIMEHNINENEKAAERKKYIQESSQGYSLSPDH